MSYLTSMSYVEGAEIDVNIRDRTIQKIDINGQIVDRTSPNWAKSLRTGLVENLRCPL